MELGQILTAAVTANASDVIISPGRAPMARIKGQVVPLTGVPALTDTDARNLIYSALPESKRSKFEAENELDYSFSLPGSARFRVNVCLQRAGISAVYRVIPGRIPTPEEIMLTPQMVALADLPRGLVLVTGPTGSGKSTTLAALVEYINCKYRKSVLTIEDPIEFIYESKNSVIMQREVGNHTASFGQALRRALRQSPDVIMVGEMRDLETIQLAITAAETGHLCFATLHTTDCASTVDRMIDVFPTGQQQQVRTQISLTLAGVISQTLIERRDGGARIAAREFMVMTNAISSLIRESKQHMIYSALETGAKFGMMTLDQDLARLIATGKIREEDGIKKALSPDSVRQLLKLQQQGV